MKALSIIVPHYNSPELLQKLLDSIPNISEIEVLVIDDNSDCDKMCYDKCKERYANRNISFYTNDVDKRGAGNARNIGLTHAKGKWLLFADADDFFLQGFWNIIKLYIDDEVDIIYFTSTSVILGTDTISDRHSYYKMLVENFCVEKNRKNELELRFKFWSPCTKLIRREMVMQNKDIRFDNTLYSNDVMFSAKLGYFAKEIKAVNKDIYCITKSAKSLTANRDKKALNIRKQVLCNYYFFLHRILSRYDMKLLGYGWKEYLYYCIVRVMNLLDIDSMWLDRFKS